MKVLSFGEVLWDIYPKSMFIGGAPFNFAAHVVKNGEYAAILSAVGNDDLGSKTLNEVNKLKVDSKYIGIIKNKPTGKCIVELNSLGVPKYNILENAAYDYIEFIEKSVDFDCLYFGTLALRSQNNIDTLDKTIKSYSFKEIFVDVNVRKPFCSKEALEFALSKATIVKMSDEEAPFISDVFGFNDNATGTAVKILKKYNNLKFVLLTMGDKGSALCMREDFKWIKCNAFPTHVKSTVGAGDSFSAAFLVQYMKRPKELKECLKVASAVSSYVVSQYEAIPDYTCLDFKRVLP